MANNSSNEVTVHCGECANQEWCVIRQYMKYSLGIANGFCAAGVKREDKEE